MINLDPKLVDQETIRKNKRKHMLKLAALPCALILLLALMAFRQSIYNGFFGLIIKNNETGFANILTQMQLFSNYAEPYIAHYNEGIIRLKDDRYAEAEQSFRASLEKNPPADKVCNIYNNLAISLEMQGDELSKVNSYDQAISFYTQAESVLLSSGCATRDDEVKHEKAQESKERTSEKRAEAIAKKNEFTSSGGSGLGTNSESVDEETIQEIKENQSKYNSQAGQIHNALGSPPSNPSTTPW